MGTELIQQLLYGVAVGTVGASALPSAECGVLATMWDQGHPWMERVRRGLSRAAAREPPSLRIRVPTPAAGSGAERALSLPLQIALVGCQVRLPSGARLPASSPVLSSLFSHTPTPTLYQLCP